MHENARSKLIEAIIVCYLILIYAIWSEVNIQIFLQFQILTMSKELEPFLAALQLLDIVGYEDLPTIVNTIKSKLQQYEADEKLLGAALNSLWQNIANKKDVKPQVLNYLEDLVCEIIKIVIRWDFRVGYQALTYIFSAAPDFYKNANVDLLLAFPIGKDRPLKQYTPKVGQQCDVVRPYVSSVSLCGWTRCKILEIEGSKYTYKFHNAEEEQPNTREKPWFAPLGTRMKDYDWRMGLDMGSPVEALLNRIWYKATIAQVSKDEKQSKRVKVTFRRFAEDGDRIDFHGNKFFGLDSNQDEWMDVLSPRVQQCGKMVDKDLCYYSHGADQLITEDQYDILFQEEYKEKPFGAIARVVNFKSISLLTFVATFVENGGIEKALEMLDTCTVDNQYLFTALAIVGFSIPSLPRMHLKNVPLEKLYNKIVSFLMQSIKSLILIKIDVAYFCYNMIGRRIYSLTKMHQNQNELRKMIIREFLKMNMEKKMIALRYMHDLVFPKRVLGEKEREQFHAFLKNEKVFEQIFSANTHEQIITRAGFLLNYMIKHQIISSQQFESLWTIVPVTDTRGRVAIEKLLTQTSKNIPISFARALIDKILQLKETELTVDNLNLLKQLKNRQLDTDTQMKILTYLWDILTVKSVNIKTSMEEEVEKVFKVFVSTIKDQTIRTKVLDSMVRKLQDCKKVKNQIQLLKDFIKSYPEKKEGESQMVEQKNEGVLQTREQAILFLKSKEIYTGLMNLLFKSKDEGAKKDILMFFSFLFDYDKQDVNQIVRAIYEKMGPVTIFLEWVQKNVDRLTSFAVDFLQNTTDFAAYESLSSSGFDAINEMIVNVNKVKKNIKVITTYKYKNQKNTDVSVGPVTGDATQKKQQKLIGPVLPEAQKHIYVLVSPFKLIGMKFLEHLLHVVKQSTVYNSIVKSIIQFISNLDESIEGKTLEYRKQFLFDIVKQIKNTIDENKYDPSIKTKLEVYINLLTEIFSETQKSGLGDLIIHSEQVEGEKITLNIDNLFDKEKTKKNKESLPKIKLVCNENITIWSLKKMLSPILLEPAQVIDVIKYSDPMKDTNNGKSLSDLLFYDNESIKISKKPAKMIPRCGLLNQQKTELTQKFERYANTIFDEYKNKQSNGLKPEDMERLSKQKWKGTLYKKKQVLDKVYTDFDSENKGWLSFIDFKKFLISKASKNENAVWILINLSGYKNNFTRASDVQQIVPINTEILPRKILSCPQVYSLILSIFENDTFKEVHLNFYRLLCMLETNKAETEQIKKKIYQIIESQKSVYTLCYALEVLNSELAKREQFYLDFWKNNGIQLIQKRIQQMFGENSSVYDLDPLTKNQILPGFMKVFNMYVSELLWKYKVVRFINQTRINYLEIEEFVKKINEINEPKESQNLKTALCNKLEQMSNAEQILKSIYTTCEMLMLNLIGKFLNEKSDYLSKLTSEVVRLVAFLVGSKANYHSFQPLAFLHGVKSLSLNIRRSTSILIYVYLFHSEPEASINEIEKFLTELLNQVPHQSKAENSNYFSILNQIIKKYLQSHPGRSKVQDEFFISLGNSLLNQLFTQVEPESRTAIISDKIILGILNVVDTLVSKHEICLGLSWRMIQITEKCLFAYNIEEKLKQTEIKPEMLTNPKQQLLFKNYVICKTEQNRDAAYNIVAKMHNLSPAIEPLYMNNYIMPLVKSISPDARITDSRSGDVGIKNFGSTCYMNSMLQVLNSVGPFRNTLMKCQSDSPLVMELKNLFAALFYSERMDYAPEKLLTSFVPPINAGIQQDTTQFLNFLFDQLESSLQTTKYRKLLDQIFKGVNTAQMICHSCGYKKQNKQQFFSFGVETQGKFDLQSALEGSYQGQIISDYLCDSCQNRGETTKRNILSEIPSILFIHLRRIVFNYDMFVNMKIHTRLQFPEELNIEPYTKEGVELRQQLGLEYMKNLSHNEEEMKKFETLTEHGKPKDFYKLKLKGVIVHSGSADAGHYYSILPQDKVWRKYDDSRVTFFGASSFETECYGGTFTSQEWGSGSSVNAYVLVYEKVIKNSLEFEAEGEMAEQVSIPYDQVKVYNSPEDYRKLWLDNHNFMLEFQLLQSKKSKGFINFLYKLINDSPDSIPKAELIAEIVYRISYHSGIVGDLLKILTSNPSLISPSLLHSHVLNDKGRTFKLLFSNDKPVRQFMASFLHLVLVESYKQGSELVKADAIAYIVQLLNGLTGEVAKNWLRVDGYFSLLNQLIRSSIDIPELWKLFMEKRFISTLIDYVMEKRSPVRINPKNYSLGTKTNPMDFSSGVSIISFYLKHSYGLTGKNYEVPSIPEHFLFHLNDNDVLCLSYMEFYRKMLRERQNLQELSFIIQRLCIMNLEFSKAVCEVILETICSITDSKDEMQDLSNLVLEVLKIRDDYWTHRAEMLLGLAYPFVIGENVMSTFDEERYVFSSTIYDVFPVECLFSYIYIYRLKNTVACFYLMSAIIQSCTVSDIASTFLLRQPSPSYLYPSYLSWMRSFIQSFMSFISPPLDAKNKERIQSAIDYTNKYVEDLLQFKKDNPDVDYYRSVITGQISNKTEIQCFEKEGIEIKLYEYEVYCAYSEPTDKGTNAGIDNYLESMRLKSRVKETSNILKFIKQPAKPIALAADVSVNAEEKELQNLFDPDSSPKTVETSTQADKKPEQGEKSVKQNKKQVIILQSQVPDEKVAEEAETEKEEINLAKVWTTKYFRQLQLVNKSKQKKVIKLLFNSESNPNLILPKEYSWKLFPKNNESLWLAKQDYDKDWGKLQMKSVVEQYVKQKHEKKNITYYWFKLYGEKQANIQSQTINRLDQMKVNEQPTETEQPKIDYHQDLDMTQINCPVCTFLNPAAMMNCDACGSALH